jgi:hypothetical protein
MSGELGDIFSGTFSHHWSIALEILLIITVLKYLVRYHAFRFNRNEISLANAANRLLVGHEWFHDRSE